MKFYFKLDLQLFAHKKAGGSASTNRNHDSVSKRRGLKKHDGEFIHSGSIIVRQLGRKYLPGLNVYHSKDWTLHALKDGFLRFTHKKINHKQRTLVNVINVN